MYVHLLSRLKRAFCVVPLFLTLLHTCTRRCQGEASSLFLLPIQIIPVTIFRGHDVLCAEIPSCEWKRVDLHCGCCYCFKWGRLVFSLFFLRAVPISAHVQWAVCTLMGWMCLLRWNLSWLNVCLGWNLCIYDTWIAFTGYPEFTPILLYLGYVTDNCMESLCGIYKYPLESIIAL